MTAHLRPVIEGPATLAAMLCRQQDCQRNADAYAADDPAMARMWQAEADALGHRIEARKSAMFRVTDESSWLDYQQAQMLAEADRRRSENPEPVVVRSRGWQIARAAFLPAYLVCLVLLIWWLL